MAEIFATVEGAKELRDELIGLARQVPFIQSLAVNKTLNEIQQGIRDEITSSSRFTLRRPEFILRTIYRKPGFWPSGDNASKADPTGAVRIHPERDVLAKFEEGGTKQPRSGQTLAIPIVRLQEPHLIIRRTSPLHLAKLPQFGQARVQRGRRRKSDRFFTIRTRTGQRLILERTAPGVTRVIYAFQRQVPIAPILRFQATAERVLNERWEKNFGDAIDRAIKTSR